MVTFKIGGKQRAAGGDEYILDELLHGQNFEKVLFLPGLL
jgi:hypothetical protein